MNLPFSSHLPIEKLGSIFHNTTNSYKYYWFLAILDHLEKQNSHIISLEEIALKMVSSVWYPLDFFKLSFGKQDGFKKLAQFVSSKIEVSHSQNAPSLFEQFHLQLSKTDLNYIYQEVSQLLRWVPFRFQRGLCENITGKDQYVNAQVIEYCNTNFSKKNSHVMYRYFGGKSALKPEYIEINVDWAVYFQKHTRVLQGFIYWELTKFLQKHNPNVIGISEKLFRPQQRDLKHANTFWKAYLKLKAEHKCIYSQENINIRTLSIDHFIPWSYAAHDEIWNLVPTTKSVNSSKSNKLPDIAFYLDKFTHLQFDAFHLIYHTHVKENHQFQKTIESALEGYVTLFGESLTNLSELPQDIFKLKLEETIKPLWQTAKNLGFEPQWKYTP